MSIPTSSLSRIPGLRIEDPEVEKANLALINDRYKGSLTGLPKEKGWVGGEILHLYQNFWFTSTTLFSVGILMVSQDTFQAKPTDIYLVTQPKSGTTWIKALAYAIVNRSRYSHINPVDHPLVTFSPHDCVPYIENEILRSKPTHTDANSTRVFGTHMPYTSLPQSILDSGCRLVYLCRNPKDVFVSMFHFLNKYKYKSIDGITFEEAAEKFSKGICACGPYWDHVIGYYKARVEHPTRVLFLTYESMKMDIANTVKRLADFMGFGFTEEEEANGAVQEIVSLCSFESLSGVNGNTIVGIRSNAFFREGKVGDWTNHLTNEMSQMFDEITKQKFYGLDISF